MFFTFFCHTLSIFQFSKLFFQILFSIQKHQHLRLSSDIYFFYYVLYKNVDVFQINVDVFEINVDVFQINVDVFEINVDVFRIFKDFSNKC